MRFGIKAGLFRNMVQKTSLCFQGCYVILKEKGIMLSSCFCAMFWDFIYFPFRTKESMDEDWFFSR